MKHYLLSLIFTMSVGCATGQKNIPPSYILNQDIGFGLIVGSINILGPYSEYKILVKNEETDKYYAFKYGEGMAIVPIPPKSDFSGIRGKLVASELPAGDYVITGWHVRSGYASIGPTSPFSIPMKVESGKITYIGSYLFEVTKKMGLTVTGVTVTLEDEYKRDMDILFKNYSNLTEAEVYMKIASDLRLENLGSGMNVGWDIPAIFLHVTY